MMVRLRLRLGLKVWMFGEKERGGGGVGGRRALYVVLYWWQEALVVSLCCLPSMGETVTLL